MLTKLEWEEKIFKDYFDKYQEVFPKEVRSKWWNSKNNMHLTEYGFRIFNKCDIKFYAFDIDSKFRWRAISIIGLARMPSPYYQDGLKLYIVEEEHAVFLKMLDLDVDTFCREFLRNEIVQ